MEICAGSQPWLFIIQASFSPNISLYADLGNWGRAMTFCTRPNYWPGMLFFVRPESWDQAGFLGLNHDIPHWTLMLARHVNFSRFRSWSWVNIKCNSLYLLCTQNPCFCKCLWSYAPNSLHNMGVIWQHCEDLSVNAFSCLTFERHPWY